MLHINNLYLYLSFSLLFTFLAFSSFPSILRYYIYPPIKFHLTVEFSLSFFRMFLLLLSVLTLTILLLISSFLCSANFVTVLILPPIFLPYWKPHTHTHAIHFLSGLLFLQFAKASSYSFVRLERRQSALIDNIKLIRHVPRGEPGIKLETPAYPSQGNYMAQPDTDNSLTVNVGIAASRRLLFEVLRVMAQ